MTSTYITASGAPVPEISGVEWSEKRYLIVDDFVGIRQLLRESLRNIGARHIDQASSGGEAMTLLGRTHYDVVLCDFNLGEGKNGQQVLEEARVRNLMVPSSVWLMVSAEKSVESVMGAAEHQPDAYIIKPITEGVLLTRLNRVWHKKQVFQQIDAAYIDKDYLRAARLCDEQIERHKVHEIDLMRMKAALLLKAGEPEKARVVYERLLEEREYNWARTGLGKIRLANGDHEAARQMFQGVIAENRFYIDAYDQLAASLELLGRHEDACGVLEKAAKLSPNSVPRQRSLGNAALRIGNVQLAEHAFRKCLAIGEYSIRRTVDAYLGMARVCGMKNDTKEALRLLAIAQRDFPGEVVQLRSKVTEGLVYHESGDYRRARKSGDQLEAMLEAEPKRPHTATCIEMATLLFAVGVKDAPVELLCHVVRNNHDNAVLLDEVQKIFDKARMSEEGVDLIAAARKEASEMMNQGALLWKTGRLGDAVAWMRASRERLPDNMRILFNSAQMLINLMQQQGYSEELMIEANGVLMHVDALAPGQQRFAQLVEQLQELVPRRRDAVDSANSANSADSAAETPAAAGE
ncbi:tetratricopeptide repeat-containing response regulator [Pseudoduganella albidiflava]|uniref:Response regulator n=1 Tax=Pseudoduganella albidiflava TaxID=321983 RepID=A0A411X4B9_9BURK|nr:tetratricopeptide repeat-containing response regulator [Pseudoduganella albidiflava]QBI03840.1 response regulator [Pseudoduganella albidiflava]GGY69435.1 response regulator [Pseudoduganella albidiflava]